MSTKQKTLKMKNTFVIATIVLGVIAIGTGAIFMARDQSEAFVETESAPKSMFAFDESKAPNWRQGATNEVSMAVFNKDQAHGCFVSAEYKPGVVDVAAEQEKLTASLERLGSGYSRESVDSKMLSLPTSAGPKQYELHQSNVTIPEGAEVIKAGQGFGYVQLSNGFVELMSQCDRPEQRASTYGALEAILLVED